MLIGIEHGEDLYRLAVNDQLDKPAAVLIEPGGRDATLRDRSLESFARLRGEVEELVHHRLDHQEVEDDRTGESCPGKKDSRDDLLQQEPGRTGAEAEAEDIEWRNDRPEIEAAFLLVVAGLGRVVAVSVCAMVAVSSVGMPVANVAMRAVMTYPVVAAIKSTVVPMAA